MEDPTLREIVRACLEDERLLEIVRDVCSMDGQRREEFRMKVVSYFMDKTSEQDVQAYRFFKTILQGNNAEVILREVRRLGSGQG